MVMSSSCEERGCKERMQGGGCEERGCKGEGMRREDVRERVQGRGCEGGCEEREHIATWNTPVTSPPLTLSHPAGNSVPLST